MTNGTIHAFHGDYGVGGDAHNWTLLRFVADEDKAAPVNPALAKKTGPDEHEGRRGKWVEVGYYGTLVSVAIALRDRLVKDGFDAPDLVQVVLDSTRYVKALVEKVATSLGRPTL